MILTMSFPFQYVENYSTPTTPHVSSPWEVDQNPAEMFIQEQVPQQQHQHQQLIQQTAYEPPPTIHLPEASPVPEPERTVSSHQQCHELHPSAVHLYPVREARPEGDGGDFKPQSPLVDTSPTGSSSSSAMPIRHAPTRPHLQLATYPYRRPQSATGGSVVRTPRERQHVRFASTGNGGRPRANTPSRLASYPPGPSSAPSASSPVTSPHQTTVPSTAPRPEQERPEQLPRRFIIRADVYYDAESKVITAMLELPGVKKTDLSVKLSTCWYNRVKQVIVVGKSSPMFPDKTGFAVRERKHGEFTRTFAVPPDTRIEDVHAEMQDGLLLLRIACHLPAEQEDAQDVQIH